MIYARAVPYTDGSSFSIEWYKTQPLSNQVVTPEIPAVPATDTMPEIPAIVAVYGMLPDPAFTAFNVADVSMLSVVNGVLK